jgi:phosphoglycolate phosphatase
MGGFPPRKTTMRTAIFDLDGTLADTSADLIASANACFRALGLGDVLQVGPDSPTALKGGRAMLRAGFARARPGWDEALVDEWYPRLLDFYAQDLDRHTRLYAGAAEAVEALLSQGWRTGICTNKPAALAEELMRRLGVRPLFHSLIGADTLPVRKPDPAPFRLSVAQAGGALDRSFLLGDTITDRDTARAAGVPVALVTFGPEGQGVAELGADALLEAFDHLPRLAAWLVA